MSFDAATGFVPERLPLTKVIFEKAVEVNEMVFALTALYATSHVTHKYPVELVFVTWLKPEKVIVFPVATIACAEPSRVEFENAFVVV
jgi:hypothetical protein